MMVSKVAVIALVAIMAVPILLGYALNISETTETEYNATGDSVNVTPLLKTSSNYTYASADLLQMNTRFIVNSSGEGPVVPEFESYTSSRTSLPAIFFQAPTNYYPGGPYSFTNYTLYYWQFTYNINNCSLRILITDNDNASYTYSNVHTVYFDYTDNSVKISRYSTQYTLVSNSVSNVKNVQYQATGTWYAESFQIYSPTSNTTSYADISAGYRFSSIPTTSAYSGILTDLPPYTKSVLFTIDLSSITDSNYEFNISNIKFTKTTTAGVVKWTVSQFNIADPIDPFDIYYDQGSSNNTYQFRITADTSGVSVGSSMYSYDTEYKLRYVGAWPDIIGEANYYQSYDFTSNIIQVGQMNLAHIGINSFSKTSPVLRIDDALYRAFEYPIIYNKTYDPVEFKANPKTTISNLTTYGDSLEFGGNTYNVKNGNITIGTHQVPVNGLVLSSVPNAGGGYDNKIGNTVISTTADPSTIRFNGQWSASISTIGQEATSVTKTEWVAGSFAWDGIDQNFLLCGLVTCIAAFIGCGIYAKKSGSGGIIPVMIVCGGAALMFFLML